MPKRLALPDAEIWMFPAFMEAPPAELLMRQLIDEIPWRQETVRLWGRSFVQPRLIAWHGDADASYRYSKKTWLPQPWTPTLMELRSRLEDVVGSKFNGVLLNYYRDHRDGMGMHSDDEPELGPTPVIASLSLGATRVMKFQHRSCAMPIARVPLVCGSLLVMRGETQRFWKHGIDKQTKACGGRLNLTFRNVLLPVGQ